MATQADDGARTGEMEGSGGGHGTERERECLTSQEKETMMGSERWGAYDWREGRVEGWVAM